MRARLAAHDPRQPGLQVGTDERFVPLDFVFPVLHGPFGEDGTIQGLLEMAGLPYAGAGVLGSAVGMDKELMKAAFAQSGLPQVDYLVLRDIAGAGERMSRASKRPWGTRSSSNR